MELTLENVNKSRNEFGVNMDGDCEGCVYEKMGCGGDCIPDAKEARSPVSCETVMDCRGRQHGICGCVGCPYRTE